MAAADGGIRKMPEFTPRRRFITASRGHELAQDLLEPGLLSLLNHKNTSGHYDCIVASGLIGKKLYHIEKTNGVYYTYNTKKTFKTKNDFYEEVIDFLTSDVSYTIVDGEFHSSNYREIQVNELKEAMNRGTPPSWHILIGEFCRDGSTSVINRDTREITETYVRDEKMFYELMWENMEEFRKKILAIEKEEDDKLHEASKEEESEDDSDDDVNDIVPDSDDSDDSDDEEKPAAKAVADEIDE